MENPVKRSITGFNLIAFSVFYMLINIADILVEYCNY